MPFKIYNSEEETKQGGEYFINSDGTFFRIFENVLYRKSEISYFNPMYERVQIDTREDSMISIII